MFQMQVFPVFSFSFCDLLFFHKPLHVDALDLVVLHTGTEIFIEKTLFSEVQAVDMSILENSVSDLENFLSMRIPLKEL